MSTILDKIKGLFKKKAEPVPPPPPEPKDDLEKLQERIRQDIMSSLAVARYGEGGQPVPWETKTFEALRDYTLKTAIKRLKKGYIDYEN